MYNIYIIIYNNIYILSYFWFCYTQFMVGGFGGTIFETNPHWDSTSHHGVKRCWTLLDILGNSSCEQETPLVYLARFLLKDYIMMYTMIHIYIYIITYTYTHID